MVESVLGSRRIVALLSLCAAAAQLACGSSGDDDGKAPNPAASGTGGTGATGGSGGGAGLPAGGNGGSAPQGPRPGVVVVENDVRGCAPLCTTTTDPASDGGGDDWAFEDGISCVIPATSTGHNQTCTTGEAVPAPVSVPGVVVADNTAGTIECYALCVFTTDPATDPEDDWSWENNASCVIPGTITAANQMCMTLMPLPAPEPRPGVIAVRDADPECVPLCRVATEPTGANSDWSYENNQSCLLPTSAKAMSARECTYGVEPDYTPPALTGTKVADGFFVEGGRLKDAYGNDFVMRGVNNAHAWFDGHAEFKAWLALDNIQAYGTNTVRIVWEKDAPPALLADILHRIVELKMVPMVELHDATGIRLASALIETAAYYTRADVVPVLQDFREYLLINVANEWSGGDDYLATYQTVIASLRAAGLEHTLVIDASGFGQNAQSLLDNWSALTTSDPEHNLLFSLHMYDLYADPMRVQTVLNQAVTAQMPFIVGEFGHQLTGTNVAWQQIMQSCEELDLGYLAWSWMGNNADTEQLDMADDWEGPLTTWGGQVMNDPNGITATSKRAKIFE